MALAACTGGGVGGQNGSDDEVTLKYAFFAPAASFPSLQMEEWKKQIEERTDGKVKVELFPGGTLLGAGDIYDGVSSGVVDVGLDSPAYDTGRFPVSSVINLPLGFTDATSASAAFLALLDEEKPKEFEQFEIITAFTTEPAYLQTKKPVRTRSDLAGMNVRTSGAQLPVLEQLGAAPVAMPMPDVPQSMQTGVIEGYVSSREVLKDFGLVDQVSYVTDYPLGMSNSFVAVMSKEKYDALPDDVKQIIQELKPEMSKWASEYHDKENVGKALDEAKGKGVETVEVEASEKPAWDEVRDKQVEAWVSRNTSIDAEKTVEKMRDLQKKHGGG
ncbi:TRAP transporter substrate-binding protein [Enemella sp. A6]|uniref:TRAP transporter substrate-binding protein n=1 Tax=Enemella sp. A6 TaxID=3440152 RepID=UPI003EBD4B21